MKRELCDKVKDILSEDRFVVDFLEGKNSYTNKPQSCENWIQVELAKRLKGKHIFIEYPEDNKSYDIVIEKKNGGRVYIQIKINGNKIGFNNDINSLSKKEEGYLLFLTTFKIGPNLKYLEQLLRRSAFKDMKNGLQSQIEPLFLEEDKSIVINCVGFGKYQS